MVGRRALHFLDAPITTPLVYFRDLSLVHMCDAVVHFFDPLGIFLHLVATEVVQLVAVYGILGALIVQIDLFLAV